VERKMNTPIVAERIRALEAVKNNIDRTLHTALDSVMVTSSGMNQEGYRIVYVNEAFSKLTGWSAEEVIGKTPKFLQGPKTEKAVLELLEDKLCNRTTFHGKTINYKKDGSEFLMEWTVLPLVDGNDEVTHYIAFQREVSNGCCRV
jgi:PAS domain S-box-containing protein